MARLTLLTFGVEYLNRLHADQINGLDEKDLCCWSCGTPFKSGDLIVIKRHSNKDHGKPYSLTVRRHAKCAILKNVITQKELVELKKVYRSFGSFVLFGFMSLYAINALEVLRGLFLAHI
jgi:hypothetical protein